MTGRAYSFLVAALLFYFFANQTQTGWLYVVAALLAGVVLAAYVLNRLSLSKLHLERRIEPSDVALHEGDDFRVNLRLTKISGLPAAHLQVTETCPLSTPSEREIAMFIPNLGQGISFDYANVVYRRGIQTFLSLKIRSRAPFGFFRRDGSIEQASPVLVYPQVKKLSALALLDQQSAAELLNPRAGVGSEVIGVRPYRSGDSPRHIHWRSVAKQRGLMSKEFAQETQPGISIVLDRYQPFPFESDNKFTPFEMAVKCAVSIGEYALRKHYPLYLAADDANMPYPQGALVWDSFMEYLAKVEPRSENQFADILRYQPLQRYVAVMLSWADDTILESLLSLKHRGTALLVVIPQIDTYPIDSIAPSATALSDILDRAEIENILIPHGADWASLLSE